MSEIIQKIEEIVQSHPVVIFIKGSPTQPFCGFTMKVCSILKKHGLNFSYVDIITHGEFRQALPGWSQWPTFPQIFVQGEMIGGCDILNEMDQNGELDALIKEHQLSCENHITNALEK